MENADVIGYIASLLLMIAFLPQAWQVWKTKSVEDISLQTYFILCVGAFFWIAYGIMLDAKPIIITNVILFLVQGSIMVCKLKYGKK